MSRMEKTQSVRITSDTGRPFAACTNLPVRQEMLSREMMRGVIGGMVLLPRDSPPPALPGVAGAAGGGSSAAKTFIVSTAVGLTVKYSDQILNGMCYVADGIGDVVSKAAQDVSGGCRRVWNWIAN